MMQACCENQDNLRLVEKREDLSVYVCAQCNRKHYELEVDVAVISSKVT